MCRGFTIEQKIHLNFDICMITLSRGCEMMSFSFLTTYLADVLTRYVVKCSCQERETHHFLSTGATEKSLHSPYLQLFAVHTSQSYMLMQVVPPSPGVVEKHLIPEGGSLR